MIQNQINSQMAAQHHSALGMAGMAGSALLGYGGIRDKSFEKFLGAMRYEHGTSSVINEMRADVRKWLSDWDK